MPQHWYWQYVAKRMSNVIWNWPRRCRGSNSEKQWNWPYLLKLLEYFDESMRKHCCHLLAVEGVPRSKSLLIFQAQIGKMRSYGFGGFLSVAETLRLGAPKIISYRKFYVFLMLVFIAFCLSQETMNISCLSFILALQRSNETYKIIKHPLRRVKLTSLENVRFTRLLIYSLAYSVTLLWLLCLLLRSGDIHSNPGPDSIISSINSSISSSEWCQTVILSDGTFNLHQTTIMGSFSCIFFLRKLHLGLNMYSFINFLQSRNNYIFQWRKFVRVR